jgi:phthiocerol/phenolphthiocerol synthesis type-I polyketide synthase E
MPGEAHAAAGARGAEPAAATGLEVAIVGMAGRFPGAPDLAAFWENLRAGVESISLLRPEELELPPEREALRRDPAYVRAAPVLDGVALFDAEFFGTSAREAQLTDPQHRLLLECAWEALEDAGYTPAGFRGLIGVYAGALLNDYLRQVSADRELHAAADPVKVLLGNEKDYLASRIAYKLGLEGPAVGVQTACSSSLVAVHLACQALLAGDCDMALAGGVAVKLPQRSGYRFQEGEIFSPDGHCRPFEARARGTVFGSGLGLVVLRRLDEALAAGDAIRAVVRGSAINNDGGLKVGFTAPRAEGQAKVIGTALLRAEVDAAGIGLLEAHGTGTPMGDPIEMQALTRVFRAATARTGFCALGSVKANVGHLNTAAGIAGLIKAVLALERETIPPQPSFERPLAALDLDRSPFFVPTRPLPWPRGGAPRRAGVSSFGIGGTNAHVVLEEAPPSPPAARRRAASLLVLAARSPAALAAQAGRLAAWLESRPDLDLEDVAYTLQVGRHPFAYRFATACGDRAAAVAALGELGARAAQGGVEIQAVPGADASRGGAALPAAPPAVVFLFPGQGAQHAGMIAALYDDEPELRLAVDRCAELLAPGLGFDVRGLLLAGAGEAGEAESRIAETLAGQAALFTAEYALAQLWMHWGVLPAAMIGHSLGEYTAACLSGVLSLADALGLVLARGRLMERLPPGAMLAAALSEEEAAAVAGGEVAVAAVNGPHRTVLSGPPAAIARLAEDLGGRGVACRRLPPAHAFHSPAVEPALAAFGAAVEAVRLSPPRVPYIANLTGTWASAEEATAPASWVRHMRGAVRFGPGLGEILRRHEDAVLLEVGPGRALSQLAAAHPRRSARNAVVPSLADPREGRCQATAMLAALGRLWCAGVAPSWPQVHAPGRRRRVPLPTYPFERRRYWAGAEPRAAGAEPPRTAAALPAAGGGAARLPMADWCHVPTWRRTPPPAPAAAAAPGSQASSQAERWLVLADGLGVGEAVGRRLAERGAAVAVVLPGTGFAEAAADRFTVDPVAADDLGALLRRHGPLTGVLHCWALSPPAAAAPPDWQRLGFGSLAALARALGRARAAGGDAAPPLRVEVVADGVLEVSGDETLVPEKATLLGPVKVMPRELAAVSCRLVDVQPRAGETARLADQIAAELASPAAAGEAILAWRGAYRWVQGYGPLPLPAAGGAAAGLRRRGVYLITGGFGGLGSVLARHLAGSCAARLALLGRSPVPLAGNGDAAPGLRRRRTIAELEAAGAEVLALQADVTRPAELQAALRQVRERFGALNGVIHAAGVAGGGLLASRPADAAAAVLAPKVAGTLALAAALADEALDFFVLCSSTLAVTGAVGQADYCAANAFLDAFAHAQARRGTRTLAVGWDAWREVGMAAAPAAAGAAPAGGPGAGHHPLLGRRHEDAAHRTVTWESALGAGSHWELAEHRAGGLPLVPGASWLERIAAALAEATGSPAVEISEVAFLAPLRVVDGQSVGVRILVERQGDGFGLAVLAAARGAGGDAAWQRHATARGRAASQAVDGPRRQDLARLRGALAAAPPGAGRAPGIEWGARWQCLRQVWVGEGEALAELELAADWHADLAEHPWHPALLDVATSFALPYLAPGPLVPVSYESLLLRRSLPPRLWCHARRRPGETADAGFARFDVALLDEAGGELGAAGGVTFKRWTGPPPAAGPPPAEAPAGILPAEGVEIFRRLLDRPGLRHVVVAVSGLAARLESAPLRGAAWRGEAAASPAPAASPDAPDGPDSLAPSGRHPRPPLDVPYAAPGLPAEQVLAEIWQELLGFERVGVHDNFFDLGGDSVVGLQMLARAAQAGLALSAGQVFQSPTVAALAAASGPPPAAAAEPTPEAFPAAELSRDGLARILARFGESE